MKPWLETLKFVMHRYAVPVACVLLVLITLGTTETWLSRMRRDSVSVSGGVKKDGLCPTQSDSVFSDTIGALPCPAECRIDMTDHDCLDAKKCCPTPCNGDSYMCVNPQNLNPTTSEQPTTPINVEEDQTNEQTQSDETPTEVNYIEEQPTTENILTT